MTETGTDPPSVAAAIAAMRAEWSRRLAMACFTMAAIVIFFLIDLWGRPEFAESLAPIAAVYVALAIAFTLSVRFAVKRRTLAIRDRFRAAEADKGGR